MREELELYRDKTSKIAPWHMLNDFWANLRGDERNDRLNKYFLTDKRTSIPTCGITKTLEKDKACKARKI